jgi:hypothetical protein
MRRSRFVVVLLVSVMLFAAAMPALASEARVGLFDPATGRWHLRTGGDDATTFFYGNPGDTPLLGDWDCDGVDTPAMYRESTGFVYYRNSNDFGVADGEFFFGIPGDIPLAGDWDDDGCDTFGIYRNGKVFLRNSLTTGVADKEFFFGIPGDRPFAGDFNGDGIDTIGLYRESTGLAYFTETLPAGAIASTDNEFFYGVPSDRIVAADWDDDVDETVGIFRPSLARFFLSNVNDTVAADQEFDFGVSTWLPVAGKFASFEITAPPSDNLTVEAVFDAGAGDFVAEVDLAALVDIPGGAPFTVSWESDLEGSLGSGAAITASLSTNLDDTASHLVTATMTTASGTVTDTVRIVLFVASN